MKRRGWVPGQRDHDYIEAISSPLGDGPGGPPTGIPAAAAGAILAIEAAAEPLGVPIVDRFTGRVLAVLASGRRRIIEVGTAYGCSTLWLALGQPADGTIVTIDPDRERTDLARGWWRQAGIGDERIAVVSAPALDAFSADEPALAGPFDLAFIDALKPEYGAYLDALRPRLAPGALVLADNVLWGGRAARADAAGGHDAATEALRAFGAAVLADPTFTATILPLGDGLLVAALR